MSHQFIHLLHSTNSCMMINNFHRERICTLFDPRTTSVLSKRAVFLTVGRGPQLGDCMVIIGRHEIFIFSTILLVNITTNFSHYRIICHFIITLILRLLTRR